MKKFFFLIMVILSLSGCFKDPIIYTNDFNHPLTQEVDNIRVKDAYIDGKKIKGQIENYGEDDQGYIVIGFILYDENDKYVGRLITYIEWCKKDSCVNFETCNAFTSFKYFKLFTIESPIRK